MSDKIDINYWYRKIVETVILITIFFIPLVFNPKFYDLFALPKITFLRIMTLLLVLSWSVKVLIIPEIVVLMHKIHYAVLAFLVAGELSTIYSTNPVISLWGNYQFYFAGLLSLSCYIVFYFFVSANIEKQLLKKIVLVILFSGGLVAVYGLFQHFGLDPLEWQTSPSQRIWSTLGNSNILGAYLVMLIPLALVQIPLYWRVPFKRLIHYLGLTFFLLFIILFFLCLFYTYSRASWLAVLGSLVFGVLIVKGELFKEKMKLRLAVLFIIFIFFITIFIFIKRNTPPDLIFKNGNIWGEGVRGVFSLKEGNISAHLIFWKTALKMIRNNLIIGTGLDTFGCNFRYYLANLPKGAWLHPYANPGYAHNEFLQIISTQGIIGISIYWWLLVILFSMGFKIIGWADYDLKLNIIGLLVSCMGFLIQNQFGFVRMVSNLYFWIFLGIIAGVDSRNKISPQVLKFRVSRWVRFGIYPVFLILLFLGSFIIIKQYYAEYHFRRGFEYMKKGEPWPGLSEYNRAVQLNPGQVQYIRYFAKGCQITSNTIKDFEKKRKLLLKSVIMYQRALRIIPQDAMLLNDLGVTYIYLGYYFNQEYYSLAKENLEKAIRLDSNFIDAYRNLKFLFYLVKQGGHSEKDSDLSGKF